MEPFENFVALAAAVLLAGAKLRRQAQVVGLLLDIETYDGHAEKLREELTLARIDRHSARSMNSK